MRIITRSEGVMDCPMICEKPSEERSGKFTSAVRVQSLDPAGFSYGKAFRLQSLKEGNRFFEFIANLSGCPSGQETNVNEQREAWEPKCTYQKVGKAIVAGD